MHSSVHTVRFSGTTVLLFRLCSMGCKPTRVLNHQSVNLSLSLSLLLAVRFCTSVTMSSVGESKLESESALMPHKPCVCMCACLRARARVCVCVCVRARARARVYFCFVLGVGFDCRQFSNGTRCMLWLIEKG